MVGLHNIVYKKIFSKNVVLQYISMRYFAITILLLMSLLIATPINAQLDQLTDIINIELIPENPGPNEVIQASLSSYDTNLNAAKITWKVDGKVTKTGAGEKVINFTTGDIGQKTTLSFSVATVEGQLIEKTFNITPGTVDIFWQTNGYVPPFYKGKSLYSHQNSVMVVAMPHLVSEGKEIPAKNIIYTWKKNENVMEDDSGYGKNTFSFEGSIISRPVKIEVTASSQNGEVQGYAHTTIYPTDPVVMFYKKDPLYGVLFQNALQGDVNIDKINELAVIGIPMFFDSTNLVYKWQVNGLQTNQNPNTNIQLFRKKEGTSGRSTVSLSVENREKILQYSASNFGVVFYQKQ